MPFFQALLIGINTYSNQKVKQAVETQYVTFQLVDGVLRATYKPSVIDLNIAQEAVKLRKQYCNNEEYPHLIKDHSVAKMTKDARDYFSSPEATEGIAAAAVITNSLFKRTMVNFFVNVTRPKIPVKMFGTEDEAMYWLKDWARVDLI